MFRVDPCVNTCEGAIGAGSGQDCGMAVKRGVWWLVGAGALVGVGAVAIGWFGVHTLFIDDKVDEAPPVFHADRDADADTGTKGDSATSGESAAAPRGTFVDRSHPTSGTALIVSDGGDRRVLRLEGFETDNGPDLFVYLSATTPDAPEGTFDDDFVDLGRLKGNVGDQNYEIPADVDLDRYATVAIWCRRFSVVFGAAALT